MASHRQMKALADDLGAVNALASSLLKMPDAGWTDWEVDFLEHMARIDGEAPLSMRQREILSELRDKSRSYTTVGGPRGIRVTRLIAQCWEARADLSEEDEAFVARLFTAHTTALQVAPLARLIRCARQIDDSYTHLAIR